MNLSQNLTQRITAGEPNTIEFNAYFDQTTVAQLIDFANQKGGMVLVGVKNTGEICGVSLGKETLNDWLSQINTATTPALTPHIALYTEQGKTVVAISIEPSSVTPININTSQIKTNKTARHLTSGNSGYQQQNLAESSHLNMPPMHFAWGLYQAETHTLNDLSTPKIERFISQINHSGRFKIQTTDIAALEKLNYIINGHPTWQAMLLFAKQPLCHHVHIGRYKTPDTMIGDQQFTDTLFEIVDLTIACVSANISNDSGLKPINNNSQQQRPAYPMPALREALLNAVIHRNYNDGSDIQIKIFDDYLTIFSPGTLYGGITVADLQADNYRPSLRNKHIVEAFYLTGQSEKYGSGFIRIRKVLEDYPEINFEITEVAGGVMATFTQQQSAVDSHVNASSNTSLNINANASSNKSLTPRVNISQNTRTNAHPCALLSGQPK